MKKGLLAGLVAAAVLSIAGPSSAADLAPMLTKAPVYTSTWAGFYAGLNAGAGFTTANVDDKDCYNCDSTHTSGFLAALGGQAGYNWQMRSLVYGVEADADWTSYNRKFILCARCNGGQTNADNATKLESILSIRGRMGLAVDSVLLYLTAGPAFGYMKNNYQFLVAGAIRDSFTDNSWHVGLAAGAGIETMIGDHWTFRAEWLHYQFQTKLVNSTAGTNQNQCCQFGFGAQTDVARLAANYRFGTF